MAKQIVDRTKLFELMLSLIAEAENALPGTGMGPKKKAWVVKEINRLVDIPWLTEPMEAVVFDLAIDLAVLGWKRGQFAAQEALREKLEE